MNIIKILKRRFFKFFPKYRYRGYSYSQDGEDMVLRTLLKKKRDYRGFYVDVGAHHPYRFSNTAYFYQNGWAGINIEPSPTLIRNFFRYRRRDTNLNIGITGQNSELVFYVFNEQAINSFDRELSLKRQNGQYRIVQELQVKTRPLSDVLDEYLPKGKKIDFLSIDVEGLDFEVLQSNNWDKYIPDFILIEQYLSEFLVENLKNDDIYRYLTERKYRLVGRTCRTSVFERQEDQ